ncbi:multiheme c-type cytochrome [Novipirellula rosea]|uniref:Multiheme c-type cytochrome n=1 Tax=Novipirellula rosea TaxID=1031540 RepID=A0ABP8MH53_9BACT
MKAKWIVIVAIVLGLALWLAYTSSQDRERMDQARRLAQRQNSQSETATSETKSKSEIDADLDVLAKRGVGMPLPDDLIFSRVQPEGYWFVGKHEGGSGVEIPFAPGRQPTPPPELKPLHENPGYVGPDACKACHPKMYESFVHTAHYRTSSRVSEDTIRGRFSEGENVLKTVDKHVKFEMRKRDDQYIQRVQFFDWKFDVPMDIILGSSKMAQTYLYWHDDQLYQANVTYLTDGDQWINSPGYIDGDAAYARPVPERCMDCHMTYFDFRKEPNHYTPDGMIFGVTCERCHGPGKEHVTHHQQNPDVKQAHAIVLPSELPRDRQLEVCGQCHSGVNNLKNPTFSYRPGDPLFDHYHRTPDDGTNSVHTSNQLTRLTASECFQNSQMGCVECHNPHQNERGQNELFSQRCLQCHNVQACGMHDKVDFDIAENCIACHMPIRATKPLRLRSVEGDVFPPLRDHLIRVDDEATAEYLQSRSQSSEPDAAR